MNAIFSAMLRQCQRLSVRSLFLLTGLLFAVGILVATSAIADCFGQPAAAIPATTYIRFGGMAAALLLLLHTGALWRFMRHQEKFEQELQLARLRADQANSARGEFLSTMSHEIRTPMNAVIGMAALIRNTPLDAEQDSFARAIEESAGALMVIINDVLDFSRIDAGKLTIEACDLDPVALAEASVDVLAVKAREKGLRLSSHIDPALPALLSGDPGRLRQILLNLLGNAIKFTALGEVALRVRCLDRHHDACRVRFEITDTGIGIDAATREKLFAPFIQADSCVTRTHGGTGLGLSISKRLIELMGGTIGVCSQPGIGSTFWFELSMPVIAAPLHLPLLKKSLLLVTPAGKVAQMMVDYAMAFGLTVRHADNALQALNVRLGSDGEHIVLIDAGIHDATVAGLMASIRARNVRVRFVLVLASEHDREMLSTAAGDTVLILPLHRAALYEALGGTFAGIADEHLAQTGSERSGRQQAPGATMDVMQQQQDQGVILLAEDNLMNQRVAMHQLNQLGYTVDTVANGQEALDALERFPYALVLMDCQMPVLDGLAATRQIRTREHTSGHHVPIVALTANAMKGDRERCLEAGMDDYLSKPIWRDQLEATLARHLAVPAQLQEPEMIDRKRLADLFDDDEEAMRRMLELFVISIRPVLEAWQQAVREQDFEAALALQHRLAGASSNLGLDQLHALVLRADVAARAADISSLMQLQEPISAAFECLHQATTNHPKELT